MKKEKLLLLMIIISEIVFVVSAVMLLKYYLAYRNEENLNRTLTEIRSEDLQKKTVSGNEESDRDTDLIDRSNLLALNEDYLMWLTIPDTKIDYPVVQRDNEYYLNHDFMGEKSSHGTVFLDENCKDTDDMLLLHGHHMKDGTMFGGLKAYRKADFAQNHTELYLDFGSGNEKYRIFAAALVDLDSETHFPYYEMPEDAEGKRDYLEKLKKASFWYQDENDKNRKDGGVQIVLLSTCEYGTADQRLVIAAVKSEP